MVFLELGPGGIGERPLDLKVEVLHVACDRLAGVPASVELGAHIAPDHVLALERGQDGVVVIANVYDVEGSFAQALAFADVDYGYA